MFLAVVTKYYRKKNQREIWKNCFQLVCSRNTILFSGYRAADG
jgi:hypothetical protein